MSAGAAWRTRSSKVSPARSIWLYTASRANAKRLLPAGVRVRGHLRNDEVSGLRPALKDEPTTSDHLCRLTAVRCSIRRTLNQDRDGATTCGTCRAPTG